MSKKTLKKHTEPWPGIRVYMPKTAHQLVRLVAAQEGISRSKVMMTIITNFFAGVKPAYIVQKFQTLTAAPVLQTPPRHPGPPTSKTRIGQQAPKAQAQPVSLSRLAAEDEAEEPEPGLSQPPSGKSW
ncbi:hypothetical protein [Bifidobacterium sp. ESL0825]|uniref:hypothetical protein n=1 Tax=Bifidobacterium sp. ESL0825 TaxID=3448587 RepID=UPI0040415617